MIKNLLLVLFLLQGVLAPAQSASTQAVPRLRIGLGLQLLGQAIFSTHAEFHFVNTKHFSLNTDIGFGRAEYADDEYNLPLPGTHVLHMGLVTNIGFPIIKVVAAVHPSTYFHGKLDFTNLNGFFGIRYTPQRKNRGLFVMAAYTPLIYTSLTTTEYIFTPIPFAIRVGAYLDHE